MKKLYILIYIIIFILIGYSLYQIINNGNNGVLYKPFVIKEESIVKDRKSKVTLSFAGDCTIGWDPRYGYQTRFDKYLDDNNGDYSYYFKNFKAYFNEDDLTIVNLEGQLTTSQNRVEKKFNFKAPTSYVKTLSSGSVEVVSFANNHAYDFGEEGYIETKNVLDSENIIHYGYSDYLIKKVNGINVGFMGMHDIAAVKYEEAKNGIDYLKENGAQLIIVSMHWGIEKSYNRTNSEQDMAHYLIDNGVDLVIGTHPHVIQEIEKYKDKYIVYSLGNFVFGGNQNPQDKDTFVFRQTFNFLNNKLILDDNIEIIPASISGKTNTNNYQPVILDGEEKLRVFNKIMKNSSGFNLSL